MVVSEPPGARVWSKRDGQRGVRPVKGAIAEFSSRGLTFEHVMGGDGPVPPMAYFRDPDGNRILLVEETTR